MISGNLTGQTGPGFPEKNQVTALIKKTNQIQDITALAGQTVKVIYGSLVDKKIIPIISTVCGDMILRIIQGVWG